MYEAGAVNEERTGSYGTGCVPVVNGADSAFGTTFLLSVGFLLNDGNAKDGFFSIEAF